MKGRSKSGEPTVERVGRIPRESSQRRKVVDPRIDEFTVTMLTRKASETPAAYPPVPKPTQVGEARSLRCARETNVKELGKLTP